MQHWTKFAETNGLPDKKDRPIRYASRRDSYIFSHYRSILYPLYEKELQKLGISECAIAYRRIPQKNKKSGKCNIHFAYEAFKKIQQANNCTAFAFDIHHFFENLDHEHIKKMWLRLLSTNQLASQYKILPEDHFKVFRAVTNYSYIDIQVAYKELGLIGEHTDQFGIKRIKYLVDRNDFPLQICTPKVFREKLAPHIKCNLNPFGIPQGSPISDLLANIYMIDFDLAMYTYVKHLGGNYYRYSDDILIILPSSQLHCSSVENEVEKHLANLAPRLLLKQEKTQIYRYVQQPDNTQNCHTLKAQSASQGLEYLGFRYDGKRIFLRNSTISGIQRKITASAKRMAIQHLKHNPTFDLMTLVQTFNYEHLIYKFGRIRKFDASDKEYSNWTFWTYVKKAKKIMGFDSQALILQVSDYKSIVRKKAKKALQYVDAHRARYI
jgi:hypothetical protein